MKKIHSSVELIYNPKTDKYDVLRDEWAWYEGPVARAGGVPTREWTNWAFYNDGTESGSTIIGSVNTNPTLEVDTIYLFRAGLEETAGNKWNNPSIRLQYNHNGGGWNDVTTSSSVVQAVDSANLTPSEDTTQRITSFTFNGNNDAVTENGLMATLRDLTSDGWENLYTFQIISGDVADTDTIELRLWDTASADTLDAVNQTNPTITVNEAAAATPAAASSTGAGTATGSAASIAESAHSSTGAATATSEGASEATSDFSSTGAGTATAEGQASALVSAEFSSDGTSTAQAVGQEIAISSGDASADGTATATGEGAAIAASDKSSAGTSTAIADSASEASSTASSDGIATATADSASTAESVYSSDGSATAIAVGQEVVAGFEAADASSAGLSTTIADSESTVTSDFSSDGTSTAIATGQEVVAGFEEAAASSEGISDAQAETASINASAALSEGVSTAIADSTEAAEGYQLWGPIGRALAKRKLKKQQQIIQTNNQNLIVIATAITNILDEYDDAA